MNERKSSDRSLLARSGFLDTSSAEVKLSLLPEWSNWMELLSNAADPDAALETLSQIINADPLVGNRIVKDELLADRLIAILGASSTLGTHFVRYPSDIEYLSGQEMKKPPELFVDSEDYLQNANALRLNYRRSLIQIAALDLTKERGFESTSASLSDLADRALQAALEIAKRESGFKTTTLSIIAMGKTGAQELNYISDVDVIFVAEPDEHAGEDWLLQATKVATLVMRTCHESLTEGSLWEVDAGLRPEGKDGPLVRSLESFRTYYDRWAQNWEFQALLKARAVAGDIEIGKRFINLAEEGIWRDRLDFVENVQAMRKRVEENIPLKDAERNIKLGIGGLRDVEFAVQLLQLVHGKSDENLRIKSTLGALRALSANGYVGRSDAQQLIDAYTWLRTLEHRMQVSRMQRTHVLPESAQDLRVLARSMDIESAEKLLSLWRENRTLVRQIHEKLFFRPLLNAVARLGSEEQRLSPAAAQARLSALGYRDPVGALSHIQALTQGVSRRAAIQKALLPAMLEWFTDGPDPDAGLFGFRQISEALGDTPWYLRMLRDSGTTAQRLARVLSSSRYATELLLRAPEATMMLEHDAEVIPRGADQLISESLSVVRRQAESEGAIEAVRAVRRRELFRTSVGDLLNLIDVDQVGRALTDVAVATLEAALESAKTQWERNQKQSLPFTFSIIGMGRFGGYEMSYASDADVLFVFETKPGSDEKIATDGAHWIAGEVRRLTSLPSPEPALIVDADLRPEGKQGPLVRTLAAYARYYAQWALLWERQALLRAQPLAGDPVLGERFVSLIDFYRYPLAGISESDVREMRRIKSRVESERLPRGSDRSLHLKLGPGGLSDVEWLVQYLQLLHAGRLNKLRHPGTLKVLEQLVKAGLISQESALTLSESWKLATRIRNAIMLVTGRSADEIPKQAEILKAVAAVLGYVRATDMVEEWRRASRRSRFIFEQMFYELGS